MLAGALAVFLGLVGLLRHGARVARQVRRPSDASTPTSTAPEAEAAGDARLPRSGSTDLKDSAVAMTSKVVNDDLETRISQRLAGAGSALTAAEWVLLHAGIAVGGGRRRLPDGRRRPGA